MPKAYAARTDDGAVAILVDDQGYVESAHLTGTSMSDNDPRGLTPPEPMLWTEFRTLLEAAFGLHFTEVPDDGTPFMLPDVPGRN